MTIDTAAQTAAVPVCGDPQSSKCDGCGSCRTCVGCHCNED